MRVLLFEAGSDPGVVEISGTLKELQSLVGGYIEMVRLEGPNVLLCNEEGRLMGLPAGAFLVNNKHGIVSIIHGSCLLCSTKDDDFADVTDYACEHYRDWVVPATSTTGKTI